jgi:hypothetical protein
MSLFCLQKYLIMTSIIKALWLKMKCSYAKCIHVKREWVVKCHHSFPFHITYEDRPLTVTSEWFRVFNADPMGRTHSE